MSKNQFQNLPSVSEVLLEIKDFNKLDNSIIIYFINKEISRYRKQAKLNKLVVLFDDNKVSIDGPTSLSTSENHLQRFKACNWNVQKVNGHNFYQIYNAIKKAKQSNNPTLIACNTLIGYGSPNKQGKNLSHGAPLGEDEIKRAKKKLGWNYPDFFVPKNPIQVWRFRGSSGQRRGPRVSRMVPWHSQTRNSDVFRLWCLPQCEIGFEHCLF